jgi:hypothetical protein
MFSNQQKNDRILSLFATFFKVVASKIISSKLITEFYKIMREPELFETYYEINKPHTSPTFWKIVGATLAIHLVAFITLSQVNLLQTKACDSPYVGKVCEALDAAYVGSVFLGTDRTSVDAPYEKTELDDADITFIDVSNMEPDFKYPEGYFEPEIIENDLAVVDPNGNPIMNPATGTISGIPGFPNASNPTITPTMPAQKLPDVNSFGKSKGGFGGNSFGKNAKLPPANPNSLTGNIPDSPIAGGGKTKVKNNTPAVISTAPKEPKLKNDSPTDLPNLGGGKEPKVKNTPKPKADTNNTAENKDLEVTADGISLNKRPLKDFAYSVKTGRDENGLNLQAPFKVTAEGVLNKDGKFDISKTKFIEKAGDEKMIEIAKEAIEAVNDSGWLAYLTALGNKKVTFTIQQDQEKIAVQIQSAVDNDTSARRIASGLNTIIAIAKGRVDDDEKTLLGGATVTNNGNVFVLNFALPQTVAQKMIKDKLDKAEANTEKKSQSNSVSVSQNTNANVVK